MKANKLIVLSSIAAMVMFTTGCGSSGSGVASSAVGGTVPTTAASTSTTSSTFTVERGPLLGAVVIDANKTVARELGNGKYIFDKAIEYPVTSTGGYIDVNRNGLVDAGELKNTLKLETKEGNVVTLATTMSSNDKLKAFLVNDLGIDVTAISKKTPSNDKAIEALSDSVFKYVMENNISDTSAMDDKELADIKGDYEERYQTYKDDNVEAKEHEASLINGMRIVTLDDAEAQSARVEIEIEGKKQEAEFKKFKEEVKKQKESEKLQDGLQKLKEEAEALKESTKTDATETETETETSTSITDTDTNATETSTSTTDTNATETSTSTTDTTADTPTTTTTSSSTATI